MESSDLLPPFKPSRSIPGKIFDFFSSLGLATVLLLLLGLLTWFATLEQVDNGLYATLNKYFYWKSVFLLPEIKGKMVPLPLLSGYWAGALLLLNLILGGVIRIRKGWKHAGNLISHMGIVFMLIGAGVAQHFSERGNMAVGEGEANNSAEDYFEYVVEVSEIKDGKSGPISVIRGKDIDDLTDGKTRVFQLPEYPFKLEIGGYLKNAQATSITEHAPDQGQRVADGYYLMELPDGRNERDEISLELNKAACYARIVNADGTKGDPFIVAGASFHPFSIRIADRIFTVDMRKRLWPMPFTVNLDKFTAEFHPGTMRPSKFVSEITRIEKGSESKVTIQMNEPMRYEGLTFFQASYGPPGAAPGQKMYSVFEVVRNPADKWPEYSLYIVAFGMAITLLQKLVFHIRAASRKHRHDKSH